MNYLRLFLILICPMLVSAQQVEVFHLDSLHTLELRNPDVIGKGVVLNKGWRWHAGDNPDWAKIEYNDSAWEGIDPTIDLGNLNQIRAAEIGWLRLKIDVDSSFVKKPLAMNLMQNGANDIYLNGNLITQIGKVSKDPATEVTYTSNGRPYALYFEKAGLQTLAVRFSFTKKNHLTNQRGVGNRFFNATIMDMDASIGAFLKEQTFLASLDYTKCGFFLYMGILHLFLYFSFKSSLTNFYFGLYALAIGLLFYLNNSVIIPRTRKTTNTRFAKRNARKTSQ